MHKRLFTGFEVIPGSELLQQYSSLQQLLLGERIKWVEIHNLHVTLWFFGEMELKDIPLIGQQLNKSCLGIAPFELTIKGFGIFGSRQKPSVIWMGIQTAPMLLRLYDQIREAMAVLGIGGDKRYKPHLTLGRVKHCKDTGQLLSAIEKMNNDNLQECRVSEFFLYESILRQEGPEYKKLERFELLGM